MKDIMKRAWTIYRTLKGTHREKLSAALKAAWAEVKNVAKVAFSGMIKIVNPSKAHYDDDSECKYITFKLWEKGSKRRVYINDYKRRTVGFIENGTVEIINNQGIDRSDINECVNSFMTSYEF